MHPYVLIPFFAGALSLAVASAMWVRDTSRGGNRPVVAILACAAYWSFLEVFWNSLDDPAWVIRLIRISSLGWMPLGVLCVHLFWTVSGARSRGHRRALAALYGLTVLSAALYITTPWGIASVHRTAWGWSYSFGPLFLFQYLPPALLTFFALAVLWRRVYPSHAPANERRQGYAVFAGIMAALALCSTTDAILPLLDVHVPRLGSASLALVGLAVAWNVHRYGYSLLAPGTFAPQILATLRDGVALVVPDGRIRSVNASFARLAGRPAEELLGQSICTLLPDASDAFREDVDGLECQLAPLGERPIPVSLSSSTLRDKQGGTVGHVVSLRDLREVSALRRSLMMAGRLAAVGELAAGISHEINNPLAFIRSNLSQMGRLWERLRERLPDADDKELRGWAEEGVELAEESLEGVERIARIVQDVGTFSRTGGEPLERTDVVALVEQSLRVAAPHLRYRARVETMLRPVPPVRGRPQELRQVFVNLLLNAAHAVNEGGRIRVATGFARGSVIVEVADEGCGIAPELLDRIFDPFFTTKPVGEGTGLGLSLSFETVRKHGGDIRVESRPGHGTRFEVTLPPVLTPEEEGAS